MSVRVRRAFPAVFRDALLRARASHVHGAAVHVYSVDEYREMRAYLSDDGTAGFALNGEEIVSVFRHSDADRGCAEELITQAVALGGRALDAFDTYLTRVYGRCGFAEVGRATWDDRYTPDGWDFAAFKEWKRGRPDVVFMKYEHALAA